MCAAETSINECRREFEVVNCCDDKNNRELVLPDIYLSSPGSAIIHACHTKIPIKAEVP
jgi:hypothetical protein